MWGMLPWQVTTTEYPIGGALEPLSIPRQQGGSYPATANGVIGRRPLAIRDVGADKGSSSLRALGAVPCFGTAHTAPASSTFQGPEGPNRLCLLLGWHSIMPRVPPPVLNVQDTGSVDDDRP
ncbi:hypothetical protein GGTG_06515 [Gaeumannomyces tritici R3-111a-1]|uniref:Uncharacterized protein n=1 Tax=Gaeumannomyces tritici (strain R3-111a-1) TaxID=644352 RepID=J3NZ15_GAET3|nr:hypothetical protein GGTG_06515 [Gaeumannomyces tritici R3-111a-1]EJT76598.1 hypothetical protein GGTG_06515 [Gaeumannomyces tritici R3-111a-1]